MRQCKGQRRRERERGERVEERSLSDLDNDDLRHRSGRVCRIDRLSLLLLCFLFAEGLFGARNEESERAEDHGLEIHDGFLDEEIANGADEKREDEKGNKEIVVCSVRVKDVILLGKEEEPHDDRMNEVRSKGEFGEWIKDARTQDSSQDSSITKKESETKEGQTKTPCCASETEIEAVFPCHPIL